MGIGAPSGGLEAVRALLSALPRDTGLAFVLVQHAAADASSNRAALLQSSTSLPVAETRDGERVEPNRVYVKPSNVDLVLDADVFRHAERRAEELPNLPIDRFLGSLATARGSDAIGVVLSGTGADGTEGLRCIQQRLGVALVEDPATARAHALPSYVVSAGVVDRVRSIPELAAELARLGERARLATHTRREELEGAAYAELFSLMRERLGVDLTGYKAAPIERGLARRMAVRGVDDLPAYLTLLRADGDELSALRDDALIGVTAFFRDPEVFEALKSVAFHAILQAKKSSEPIRIWVAGCSSGEEAYSLGICLLEYMEELQLSHPIRIFGTDVSEGAIARARAAVYPEAAFAQMSEERRRRYFVRVGDGLRVERTVRELCRFVRHDLARDPPFSRIDLVSCRNVLISFEDRLQERALSSFEYALNQPGYLLLGRSENLARFGDGFTALEKWHPIFVRAAGRAAPARTSLVDTRTTPPSSATVAAQAAVSAPLDLSRHLDRALLTRFAPPAVLVDARFDALQFRGDTGPFLSPPSGAPQKNLLKMARVGLLAPLRAALHRARDERIQVTAEDVTVDVHGVPVVIDVSVSPFSAHPLDAEPMFLVCFHARGQPSRQARLVEHPPGRSLEGAESALRARELELFAMKDYLETVVEDHRRTNDALNTANGELVSANEALQSTIEDLLAAQEELHATNEELTVVNEELRSSNREMASLNVEYTNLLAAIDIPILILDRERRIRRFTPRALSILNVVPSDVGRPIDDFNVHIRDLDLGTVVDDVAEHSRRFDSEVQARDGAWYRVQVRPYRSSDDRIEGATVSFIDINTLKHELTEAERAKEVAVRADRAKDAFLAVLSHELRTPLAAVLIQAQALVRQDNTNLDRLRRAGEAIARGTHRQVQLIDELLDVSRIVVGKLQVKMEVVDLGLVVRDALASAAAAAAKRGLALALSIDDGPTFIAGDEARLMQVVSNLLANAIKFSRDGGRIEVALSRASGRATLTVIDDGVGIDPAFLPHIFNRFAQEDSSNTRAHGGLGLGLMIVKHLVDAHGGTVDAWSDGHDKGATLRVTLPLRDEHELRGPMERAPKDDDDDASGAWSGVSRIESVLRAKRVLVVDDDEGAREALADVFNDCGSSVRTATSVATALPVVEAGWADLIICDLAMPDEDGCSLMRRVRAREGRWGGHVPAVALTGLAGTDDRARALQAGFDEHLTKPIDLASLVRTAGAVCLSASIEGST